jgi:bla regulator protein BlaR1
MTHALAAHLWQSTFFALAAGCMTVAFRRNPAQVRYWLWLSASLKFLVPFALLLNLGSYLETWIPAAGQMAAPLASYPLASYTIEHISAPFLPESLPSPSPAPDTIDWIPLTILAVWLAGFASVVWIRFRGWLRIREAVRGGTATGIWETVKICVSPYLLEPGVVGIVRPVILLPEGIAEKLMPLELETVLAHEICHIRRRDNLFAAIHMSVEAIFWFHPLVWCIGARLVEERERACDEEVVSRGSHPEVYADAILNVCKLYARSPLPCVSGVSGATIRRRIEAILLNRSLQSLSHAKKLLLAGAGTAALAGPVAIGLLIAMGGASEVGAQSTRQKFEVASIHNCDPMAVAPLREGGGLGITGPSPNRVIKNCVTVMSLLQDAYVIFDGGQNRSPRSIQMPPIEKAPAWVSSELYSIEAKAEGTPGQPAMLGPMMQSLLEDRFHLKLRRETRSGPAYELTVTKGGSKLKNNDGTCSVDVPSSAVSRDPATGSSVSGFPAGRVSPPSEPGVPCRLMLNLRNGPNNLLVLSAGTLDGFCAYLSRVTGLPVIDKTELRGKFDLRLEFLPDQATPGAKAGDPSEGPTDLQPGASLFTAVEQQLGLKLVPVKGTREVIVIDHIEKPSRN